MKYFDFLNQTVDHCIAQGELYQIPQEESSMKFHTDGFEACRNKPPHELAALLQESVKNRAEHFGQSDYWYFRRYEVQVEWICNIVSVLLAARGNAPLAAHLPTSAAAEQLARLIGKQLIEFPVYEKASDLKKTPTKFV